MYVSNWNSEKGKNKIFTIKKNKSFIMNLRSLNLSVAQIQICLRLGFFIRLKLQYHQGRTIVCTHNVVPNVSTSELHIQMYAYFSAQWESINSSFKSANYICITCIIVQMVHIKYSFIYKLNRNEYKNNNVFYSKEILLGKDHMLLVFQ